MRARNVAGKLLDTAILVLDECSMVGCEAYSECNDVLQAARKAMDPRNDEERAMYAQMSTMPFGGFILVLSGDMYQLPPVCATPLYRNRATIDRCNSRVTFLGKMLWDKINVFVELKRNYRFSGSSEELLPSFLHGARIGDPDQSLLHKINGTCIMTSVSTAVARSNDAAIWIAPTNALVDEHNTRALESLRSRGTEMMYTYVYITFLHILNLNLPLGLPIYRAVAKHIPAAEGVRLVDLQISKRLHAIRKDKYGNDLPQSNMVFAIGQRVRVTVNAGTQIGIYNGALGTIYAFSFQDTVCKRDMEPTISAPAIAVQQRDTPVIFVQMDKMELQPPTLNSDGSLAPSRQISCSTTIDRLVPFVQSTATTVESYGSKYTRIQYPIEPANASTCHKCQGITAAHGVVIDMPSSTCTMALAYVALSRAKSIAEDPITKKLSVVLLKPLLMKHFRIPDNARSEIEAEYCRLRGLPSFWNPTNA